MKVIIMSFAIISSFEPNGPISSRNCPEIDMSLCLWIQSAEEMFLNLCTYMKVLLLVFPKKFLFPSNRPNLDAKMLVVGT